MLITPERERSLYYVRPFWGSIMGCHYNCISGWADFKHDKGSLVMGLSVQG